MENETMVTEEVIETVEHPTEQTPKTYTQEEVDAIVGKRVARKEAKIRKEYDRKYGDLEEVLKAGTGKSDVGELTSAFKDFYAQKGIKLPSREYSEADIEVLSNADVKEIIDMGYEDVVAEVDRLADIGTDNMTAREKAVFRKLAAHRMNAEHSNALSKLGVTEDVYSSKEFRDFASKFNSNTPITEVYRIFEQTQPKPNIKTMGSMKQIQNSGAKDYYSPEEISRLSLDDLADPHVWENVRKSMTAK